MADDNYTQQMRTQQIPAQNGQHAQQYQRSQQYQPTQQIQQPQYQQQFQQPQPQYQQPQYPRQMQVLSKDVTTTGQWVLNLFLVAIPIIGLILLFVWAFSSGTAPSKQNWARANLVWILIAIVVSVVVSAACVLLGVPIQDYLRYYLQ